MYKQIKKLSTWLQKSHLVLPSERSSIVPAVYVGRFTKSP